MMDNPVVVAIAYGCFGWCIGSVIIWIAKGIRKVT
jgi:hypothetical protein